uniref:Putative secreted protein n=1 Tax=Panstrongylus lignarius TaxID=156445 RepID=A0A224Y0N3_9HEMI
MFNSSCKIFLTVSLSAFTVSAIIQMLIRRSPRTISLILVTVCGVETETGRPGRWSSSVFCRPFIPFENTRTR